MAPARGRGRIRLMLRGRLFVLHPTALIALWAAYVAGLELLSWRGLAVATLSAPILLDAAIRARFLQLLRRSRWLVLILPLVYACSVPGQPLWPGVSLISWPGIEAGALRVMRLLLMLAALAALLTALEPPRLIFGLYALARPFSCLGLDARALAVRLSLVLEGAQHAAPAKPWKLALSQLEGTPYEAPAQITLHRQAWSWGDAAALLLAASWLGVLLA